MQDITEFASEMGIGYARFLNMSWREFDYMSIGYQRRIERGWDFNRTLIASMYNSSGFSKRKVKPRDVMKLPMLDKAQPLRRVKRETVDRMLMYLN